MRGKQGTPSKTKRPKFQAAKRETKTPRVPPLRKRWMEPRPAPTSMRSRLAYIIPRLSQARYLRLHQDHHKTTTIKSTLAKQEELRLPSSETSGSQRNKLTQKRGLYKVGSEIGSPQIGSPLTVLAPAVSFPASVVFNLEMRQRLSACTPESTGFLGG